MNELMSGFHLPFYRSAFARPQAFVPPLPPPRPPPPEPPPPDMPAACKARAQHDCPGPYHRIDDCETCIRSHAADLLAHTCPRGPKKGSVSCVLGGSPLLIVPPFDRRDTRLGQVLRGYQARVHNQPHAPQPPSRTAGPTRAAVSTQRMRRRPAAPGGVQGGHGEAVPTRRPRKQHDEGVPRLREEQADRPASYGCLPAQGSQGWSAAVLHGDCRVLWQRKQRWCVMPMDRPFDSQLCSSAASASS